ncbi:hypothetical protein [Oryza sativa Japonica Group]|uniref:Uncharacterized protein n=1 Tax=Oryza sativa subsp. japonica TaxID=39947 RepID=Q5QMW4_ORYSJ|nr:hypothetical protein [Oryza sativa Japonica Group]BAD73723.1 hypothetical protein [Oryza sativa Japonica Group]
MEAMPTFTNARRQREAEAEELRNGDATAVAEGGGGGGGGAMVTGMTMAMALGGGGGVRGAVLIHDFSLLCKEYLNFRRATIQSNSSERLRAREEAEPLVQHSDKVRMAAKRVMPAGGGQWLLHQPPNHR